MAPPHGTAEIPVRRSAEILHQKTRLANKKNVEETVVSRNRGERDGHFCFRIRVIPRSQGVCVETSEKNVLVVREAPASLQRHPPPRLINAMLLASQSCRQSDDERCKIFRRVLLPAHLVRC